MDRKLNIKNLYDQIEKLIGRELAYSELKHLTDKMLDEVFALHEEESEETIKLDYSRMHLALHHTSNKEVEFVLFHQRKIKPNSPKIRTKEYYDELKKAVTQIGIDIKRLIK